MKPGYLDCYRDSSPTFGSMLMGQPDRVNVSKTYSLKMGLVPLKWTILTLLFTMLHADMLFPVSTPTATGTTTIVAGGTDMDCRIGTFSTCLKAAIYYQVMTVTDGLKLFDSTGVVVAKFNTPDSANVKYGMNYKTSPTDSIVITSYLSSMQRLNLQLSGGVYTLVSSQAYSGTGAVLATHVESTSDYLYLAGSHDSPVSNKKMLYSNLGTSMN